MKREAGAERGGFQRRIVTRFQKRLARSDVAGESVPLPLLSRQRKFQDPFPLSRRGCLTFAHLPHWPLGMWKASAAVLAATIRSPAMPRRKRRRRSPGTERTPKDCGRCGHAPSARIGLRPQVRRSKLTRVNAFPFSTEAPARFLGNV